jgi:hypothetical protein
LIARHYDMDTPSPASGKVKVSHRKQKVLRSHEILVKRRQRVAASRDLIALPPPQAMNVLSPSPSPSMVAGSVVVDSPTVLLPNAVTPATTRGGTKLSSGDHLTDRTHNIRRRKGIVLNDASAMDYLHS